MAHDREIAGIRCTEILSELSNYLAGELPVETAEKIESHLAECSWCEHFGGEFKTLVTKLRVELNPQEPTEEQTESLLEALGLD